MLSPAGGNILPSGALSTLPADALPARRQGALSRLGKLVCMTLAERERQEEEATKGFGEMQRVVNTTFSKGN